jgi:hypothetical protein
MIRLVHDILDKQLKDENHDNAGRIDGIVLILRDDRPPLVRYVEVGPTTLLSRLSLRLARWYARWDARVRGDRGVPFRIPWSGITHQGPTVFMNQNVENTPINALEDWLRVHIVERLPWAR